MEQDMKQLVLQTINGDMQAFETLYNLSSRQVYYTCLSFVRNEQDAADLMQEAYIQALTHLSTLQKPERFIQWVNQIAANKCKNYLLKKQPALVADEILEGMAVEEDDLSLPENYVTNDAKRKIIMDIMKERLSVLQYETVILYYFDELSIEEIAECMECPAGTVSYRLSAARAKIKEGILEYEEENGEKLHCYGGFVFFTALFTAELQGLKVPDVFQNIVSVFPQNISGAAMSGTAGSGASKAVFKTVKAKVIAGIAAAAVIGGAAAIVAVSGSKPDDTPDSSGFLISKTVDKDDTNKDDTNKPASDGVHIYMEGFDPSKRWLTMQDFSEGQLSEAPADVTFLKFPDITEDGLAMPVDMETMLTILDEAHVFGTEAKGVGLLTCTDKTVLAGESEDFYGDYYDENSTQEDKVSSAWNFSLYNYSDEKVTLQDCFAQNLYVISNNFYQDDTWRILGFTDEEVDFNENEKNYSDCYVKTLDMMVERFGSPHRVTIFGNAADIGDALSNLSSEQGLKIDSTVASYIQSVMSEEVAIEVYRLTWVFEDYVIFVDVQESYMPSSNPDYPDRQEIRSLMPDLYCRELYDILVSEKEVPFDRENQIEELFPDGFLVTGDN